jgi:VWFA-related protein
MAMKSIHRNAIFRILCGLKVSLAISAPVVLAALAILAQSQNQAPAPIRSESHAVLISVAVRDATGKSVDNLRKEDFTVTDDGKPRDFRMFPGDSSSGRQHPPRLDGGYFSNRYAAQAPRVTAIVMDSLNTPMSDQSMARQEAIKAIQAMPLDESIAIYAMGRQLKILQDYTTDRALLLQAIQSYIPSPPLSSNPAAASSASNSAEHRGGREILGNGGPAARQEDEYYFRLKLNLTMATLQTIATHITGASHRNSIIWITAGMPLASEYEAQVQATLNAINDANIALYPVDARGLSPDPRAIVNDLVLDRLAQDTGGHAYYNRNDLSAAIEEALAAPRSTYLLGFYLSGGELDDRFHRLHVTVNRPGVTLSYRDGYTATADPNAGKKSKEPLDAELLATQDSTEVGIDAKVGTGEPARGAKGKTLVVSLVLDRDTLTKPAPGKKIDILELFAELDSRGQTVARVHESISFDVPSGDRQPGYTQTIPLQDGAEKLKIIVQDKATGRTGSLTIPLAARP